MRTKTKKLIWLFSVNGKKRIGHSLRAHFILLFFKWESSCSLLGRDFFFYFRSYVHSGAKRTNERKKAAELRWTHMNTRHNECLCAADEWKIERRSKHMSKQNVNWRWWMARDSKSAHMGLSVLAIAKAILIKRAIFLFNIIYSFL